MIKTIREVYNLLYRPSDMLNEIKSINSYFFSYLNRIATRSYSLVKPFLAISNLLILFGILAIILYSLAFYSIIPAPVQKPVTRMHKNHNTLAGTISVDSLDKETYRVFLKLKLPEDEANYNLGNFETSLKFFMANGERREAKNMGIMEFQSSTTRFLKAVFCFPLIMLGVVSETQDVVVRYDCFIKNPEEIKKISVEIHSSVIKVSSMSVVFEVEFYGLRLFVMNNKVLIFFFGTILIFLVLVGFFCTLVGLLEISEILREGEVSGKID